MGVMDKHQLIKLSRDRSVRWGSGLFWVDGVNFVHQALENAWEVDTLIYLADKLDSEFKHQVVHAVPKDNRMLLAHAVYEKLAYKNDVQGVGAVIKMKYQKNVVLSGKGLVLENTQYGGNMGTMMRSALAFGITNIYLVGKTVDPFSPEVVRASMGTIFGINIILIDDINLLSNQNNLALTLDKSAQDLRSKILDPRPYLLWLGNEGRGLTRQALELCQTKLRIEISGLVDSLNVSEAAAIAMYALA